jgi:hypothetical protein
MMSRGRLGRHAFETPRPSASPPRASPGQRAETAAAVVCNADLTRSAISQRCGMVGRRRSGRAHEAPSRRSADNEFKWESDVGCLAARRSLTVWRNVGDDSDGLGAHPNAFIRNKTRAVDTISPP